MSAPTPDTLAGRLRLLAERLEADGTFGAKIVAEDCLAAADLLSGDVTYQYAHILDHGRDDVIGTRERPLMWTDTAMDRWPLNEQGPWGRTTVNGYPATVVKRTIVHGPWLDCPAPDGGVPDDWTETGDDRT